eukprot:snap_masked-scaffold_139-processed-gene-0.2-mRNA-1 protein AED:1.00 eAED:1.00 QI:0/0/0/0/1/1/2/0/67
MWLFGVSSSLLSSIFKLNDEILKGICLNEEKKKKSEFSEYSFMVMLLRNGNIESFYEKHTDTLLENL